ncbi:MAG: photosystem reaction center subunit H, partial [Geitlerinemataceae cyanobacterium]
EAWSEDDWRDSEPEPVYQEQREEVYVEYEEEDNWNETSRYQQIEYEPQEARPPEKYPEYAQYDEYEDIEADAWASEDDRRSGYQPQKVNLPSKNKIPEYEEESGY